MSAMGTGGRPGANMPPEPSGRAAGRRPVIHRRGKGRSGCGVAVGRAEEAGDANGLERPSRPVRRSLLGILQAGETRKFECLKQHRLRARHLRRRHRPEGRDGRQVVLSGVIQGHPDTDLAEVPTADGHPGGVSSSGQGHDQHEADHHHDRQDDDHLANSHSPARFHDVAPMTLERLFDKNPPCPTQSWPCSTLGAKIPCHPTSEQFPARDQGVAIEDEPDFVKLVRAHSRHPGRSRTRHDRGCESGSRAFGCGPSAAHPRSSAAATPRTNVTPSAPATVKNAATGDCSASCANGRNQNG